MKTPLISAVALAAAIPLLLTGCGADNSSTDEGTGTSTGTSIGTNDTSPAQDADTLFGDLQNAGSIPKDFPATKDLRVEVNDDEFAIAWKGDAMTNGCKPGDASPNSTASILLIADGALTDIQQCGGVWQATQADGSHVAWN